MIKDPRLLVLLMAVFVTGWHGVFCKKWNGVMIAVPGYSHTQKAPLCWIILGGALGFFALAGVVDPANTAVVVCHLVTGVVAALVAASLHHLAIVDQGDSLRIRFGPVPLFRRTVRYAEIEKVEVGRTLLLEGWGIHYSILRGGWVWNLWGRDCMVVYWKKGSVLRIGTDDAENLARFVEVKITETK